MVSAAAPVYSSIAALRQRRSDGCTDVRYVPAGPTPEADGNALGTTRAAETVNPNARAAESASMSFHSYPLVMSSERSPIRLNPRFHRRKKAASRAALHRTETERLAVVRHARILP